MSQKLSDGTEAGRILEVSGDGDHKRGQGRQGSMTSSRMIVCRQKAEGLVGSGSRSERSPDTQSPSVPALLYILCWFQEEGRIIFALWLKKLMLKEVRDLLKVKSLWL